MNMSAQPRSVLNLINDWTENIDSKLIIYVDDVKSGRNAEMMGASGLQNPPH